MGVGSVIRTDADPLAQRAVGSSDADTLCAFKNITAETVPEKIRGRFISLKFYKGPQCEHDPHIMGQRTVVEGGEYQSGQNLNVHYKDCSSTIGLLSQHNKPPHLSVQLHRGQQLAAMLPLGFARRPSNIGSVPGMRPRLESSHCFVARGTPNPASAPRISSMSLTLPHGVQVATPTVVARPPGTHVARCFAI